jgi:hypothetical protein
VIAKPEDTMRLKLSALKSIPKALPIPAVFPAPDKKAPFSRGLDS